MAVKSLGYRCVSPKGCLVVTETMGTLGDLWRQRVRWQRGALQTLQNYGVSRTTLPYILRQLETGFGLTMICLLWIVAGLSLIEGSLAAHPFWLGVGAVFQVERLVSGWRSGWKGRVIAGTFVIDMAFDLFIGIVYVACLVKAAVGVKLEWGVSSIDSLTGKAN